MPRTGPRRQTTTKVATTTTRTAATTLDSVSALFSLTVNLPPKNIVGRRIAHTARTRVIIMIPIPVKPHHITTHVGATDVVAFRATMDLRPVLGM